MIISVLLLHSVVSSQEQSSFILSLEKGVNPTTVSSMLSEKVVHIEPIFKDLNLWNVTIQTSLKKKLKKSLEGQQGVKYLKEDLIARTRLSPNDPQEPAQWSLRNIFMQEAWDITTGGKNVVGHDIVVGILDDGFQVDHQDLAGSIWINEDEIPDNGLDDDSNGFIDDREGWNARAGDDNHLVGDHGTSVAGIIGAASNNELDMAGINWDVKLMLTSSGRIGEYRVSDIVKSYEYIYEQRKLYNQTNGERGAYVVVTNYSGGIPQRFPEDAPAWCEVFDILGSVGIVSVGSTVNNSEDVDLVGDLPSTCTSDFLIVATNTGDLYQLNQNAGFGAISVDLGAPGDEVITLATNDILDLRFFGTSAAAPHVAGVISLMYNLMCEETYQQSIEDPESVALQIKGAILQSVTRNRDLVDLTVSGGVLNALTSLQTADAAFGDCCKVFIEELTSTDESCLEASDGTLEIDASGRDLTGQLAFTMQNPDGSIESPLPNFNSVPAGDYTLTAFDDGNPLCFADTTVSFAANEELCPFGEFEIKEVVQSTESELLTLLYDLDEQKNVTFQIHNSVGQLVYSVLDTPSLMETRSHDIDISGLPSGVYFASILSNGNRDTSTFRVVR